jgi:hypothetical protein
MVIAILKSPKVAAGPNIAGSVNQVMQGEGEEKAASRGAAFHYGRPRRCEAAHRIGAGG